MRTIIGIASSEPSPTPRGIDRRELLGLLVSELRQHMEASSDSSCPTVNRELAMRKQEYTLYNHLDDDHVRQGLLLLIGYCERRIERLRDDSAKALCKARIAHLRCKILDIEWSAKMMQQQIIEEDLEGRARARPNGSFGASWKQGEGAWNGVSDRGLP